MHKEKLIQTIQFWRATVEQDTLYPRVLSKKIDLNTVEVIDIVGSRRSGKSSLLKLLIRTIPSSHHWLYMNFEDPFFLENNSPSVIEELIATSEEYFGSPLSYLFFDEIQAIDQWEMPIRKLRDSKRYHIVITGSSSKLLSAELATVLSGRHRTFHLLPLSFLEYLSFRGMSARDAKDIFVRATFFSKAFEDYIACGGFPQIVLSDDRELLKQYYYDIVERDIINRYAVREIEILKRIGVFLMTHTAKTLSVASIRKAYGISHELAATYAGYFKEVFLTFDVALFSYSLKTQQKSLKKIYAGDTGLAGAVSFRFSQDKGRMFENAIFLQLRRMEKEVYYFKSPVGEVDFIIKNPDGTYEAIQVAWHLDNERTRKREVKALHEAAKKIPITSAKILTCDESETIASESLPIKIQPAYQWVLEQG